MQSCSLFFFFEHGSNSYAFFFSVNFWSSAINILGSGLGDTYYPSNELDPYLKDKNVSDIVPNHRSV